jgi:hypothetical protein
MMRVGQVSDWSAFNLGLHVLDQRELVHLSNTRRERLEACGGTGATQTQLEAMILAKKW